MEISVYVSLVAILTFSAVLTSDCKTGVVCPEPLRNIVDKFGCDPIKCFSTLVPSNCTALGSVYEEKLTLCGCCPGCAKYVGYEPSRDSEDLKCNPNFDEKILAYDETCKDLFCPIVKNCKPGLVCDKDTLLCVLLKEIPTCQGRCWLQKAIQEVSDSNWKWTPRCTADGYYEPLQMKGVRNNGDCYCVDECGKKILGRSRWLNDNCANQTCGCSRHVHKLRTVEGRIATLHCTSDGNYEPLQCDTDSSLCYCVDPTFGRVMGDVLPEHLWKQLPCYDSNALHFADGGKYLRRCESEWAPGQQLSDEAKLHGLTFSIRDLECDYDGSFKPVFQDKFANQEKCVDKKGEQIPGFFRQITGGTDMNCNCARDRLFFAALGIQFSKLCQDQTGNYRPYDSIGNYGQCIDADGYVYGPEVPSEYVCCLEIVDGTHTCQDPVAAEMCKSTFKPCNLYLLARE